MRKQARDHCSHLRPSAIWSFLQLGHGFHFFPHKNPLSLFWTLYLILPLSVCFAEILKSFFSSKKWFSPYSLPVLATTFLKKWSTVFPPQGLILVLSTYSWISRYAGMTFSSVLWAVFSPAYTGGSHSSPTSYPCHELLSYSPRTQSLMLLYSWLLWFFLSCIFICFPLFRLRILKLCIC